MAKILIVDDSGAMRRKLKTIPMDAGHTVVGEATNGDQAFRQYGEYKPDLVTMDITMPLVNGIDAVKKIVDSYPEANIVMVSALGHRRMVLEAMQNGAKHYIIKPFDIKSVVGTINRVLSD